MMRDLTRFVLYDLHQVQADSAATNGLETIREGGDDEDIDETFIWSDLSGQPFKPKTGLAKKKRTFVAYASSLRLQAKLMSVISLSQERCQNLWSDKLEPHMKNAVLESLVRRGRWKEANMQLYNDLVLWRAKVARELECLAPFVAPLDFLVYVAWKRPRSVAAIRRITHDYPAVLKDKDHYIHELSYS
jgi:hypothetical protein